MSACVCVCVCVCARARTCMHTAAHSCPILLGPKDCSVPGSSVHGLLQVRILQWVAISFRGSSNPGFEPMSPTWQAEPHANL